jgi:hypothetical protein
VGLCSCINQHPPVESGPQVLRSPESNKFHKFQTRTKTLKLCSKKMWNLNRRWRDGVGRLTSRSQGGHRSGQFQPLFFSKLPLEIRLLIYRHVFPVCDEAIHVGVLVVPGKTKYFFNPCVGPSFEDWEYDDSSSGWGTHFSGRIHKDCHEGFEERRKEQYQWIKSKRTKRAIPNSVVSLMLTCTKMLVYANPTL